MGMLGSLADVAIGAVTLNPTKVAVGVAGVGASVVGEAGKTLMNGGSNALLGAYENMPGNSISEMDD
jgi:hypothetical protein